MPLPASLQVKLPDHWPSLRQRTALPCFHLPALPRVLKMEEFFPETYRLDIRDERQAFFTLFDGERPLGRARHTKRVDKIRFRPQQGGRKVGQSQAWKKWDSS